MVKKLELLAPVGSFAMLYSACEAGADAVYFGVRGMNMREGAKNFSLRDFRKIKQICQGYPRKPKMYLTMNTVVYEEELERIENIVKSAKRYVDAIICWDLSVIELCVKYGVPFHVSTQGSISNSKAAKFYKKLGAERVVLARELNLKQIKKISKKVEVECFCHGAMCVSVSGRCFISQFLTGHSANRGKCSQPCRRAWKVTDDEGKELKLINNRVMSAKDLCTLPFVEKMKAAGITSFKIEGRNRTPEYVYAVTRVYRAALDNKLSRVEIQKGLDELKKVYNRGLSSGFYIRMPTSDDFSFSDTGEQTESKEYVARVEKYWPKAGVGLVKMHAGTLKVGDEIFLMSDKMAVKKIKVESMQVEGEDVKSAKKGMEVGIKMPKCGKGTLVYKVVKKES